MHKIFLLITFFTLPLLADFFPSKVETTISSVVGNKITLKSTFPKNGMSGVIIHNYGSGISAITSHVIQTSARKAKLLEETTLLYHDKLPTINTNAKVGDKVIGGYLYQNVLLLAPNADTYSRIVSSHTKKWIHPDLFAVFISAKGDAKATKENLSEFSKKYQIGLIYIVRKNSAILFDPISQKVISKKSISSLPQEGDYPFFMRFDELDNSWFFKDEKGNYYDDMEQI